jgi:hypothetical protein
MAGEKLAEARIFLYVDGSEQEEAQELVRESLEEVVGVRYGDCSEEVLVWEEELLGLQELQEEKVRSWIAVERSVVEGRASGKKKTSRYIHPT